MVVFPSPGGRPTNAHPNYIFGQVDRRLARHTAVAQRRSKVKYLVAIGAIADGYKRATAGALGE